MAVESLWPKHIVQETGPDSPRELLKSQAEALGPLTDNLLRGLVEFSAYNGKLALDFIVVAPALDDYQYRLFKLWPHEGPDPYPARLIVSSKDIRKIPSSAALREELRKIFSSDSTLRVISDLVAYSRERQSNESEDAA